ncbi:galaxin-like [Mizuhopecten yessoensis]|uniref:Usherin n=1 Tax=Mizuhopecten yessoensis TaxID=6573 RepID=A0A210QHI5_MIZYE|nr:galaxin-like [Mizuhopecten yessoensis]OWF48146.1 Usherin [Mizuhopecten yessoensis]
MYCVHVFRLLAVFFFCLKGSDLVNGADCAGKEIDTEASFCCGSTIHKKINGDGLLWDCCEGANKPYSHIEECCGSEIRKRSRFLGCCKNRFYNTSTHNCCEESGKVLHREGSRSCCGRSTFKPSTHLCCGNEHRLHDREANTACCGNIVYNQTTHVCVGNDRVVKKGFGVCGIMINSNNMICCNNVSHVKKYRQSDCCGTRLIDASKTGCCNDEVSYRLDKKKCCGAKVIRKAQQCCGGRAIKASCKCCPKGRKKCCGTKTKRKQKTLNCSTGQRWSTISDLVDSNGCLHQAFFIKKQKQQRYQQKKQLRGRKEKAFWKLDKSCDFIKKKKKFVIVETVTGGQFPVQSNKRNTRRLRYIKKKCTGS